MEPNWKEEIIRILDKVQDTKVLRRVLENSREGLLVPGQLIYW